MNTNLTMDCLFLKQNILIEYIMEKEKINWRLSLTFLKNKKSVVRFSAQQLVSVQPMTRPTGRIFFYDPPGIHNHEDFLRMRWYEGSGSPKRKKFSAFEIRKDTGKILLEYGSLVCKL